MNVKSMPTPAQSRQRESTAFHSGRALLLGRNKELDCAGPLMPRIAIGARNDVMEYEAERAAGHAMSTSRHSSLSARNPSGMAGRGAGEAPESVSRILDKPGMPLESTVRRDMERRFGHDFSRVRVHVGAEAAQSARDVRARAYTVGNDVVFNTSQYAPTSQAGRRLIAHELTHVVQQGGTGASYGTAGGQPHAKMDGATRVLDVPGGGSQLLLQRDPEDSPPPSELPASPVAPAEGGETVPADAGAQPEQAAPATPATPALTLSPAATLTRGDTWTATIAFTPNAGETKNIVAWRYITPNHGTVARANTEADFQTAWTGRMALSGTLEFDYTTAPPGGAASAVQTIRQAVTVSDRTGVTWAASPTLRAENSYSGRPSPPSVFSDLGFHNVTITNPAATSSRISGGPNSGFDFVGALTAGTYVSQPRIHPDLTTAASRFNTFHNSPSRLYLQAGATRTLIPLTEYSGLSTAGGSLTFSVPDWEVFYKAKNFYAVTATSTSGAGPVPVRNAWWGLDSNSATAGLTVMNDAAIRTALNIPATEGFRLSATSRGSWDGYQLMQSAAILTGTRSHEYVHAQHSHRANFTAMLRAVDPQRKIEQTVSSPSNTVDFTAKITEWIAEIIKPNHELVDEAASRRAEAFVEIAGQEMAGVNTDPATGNFLGSIWNITADRQMDN